MDITQQVKGFCAENEIDLNDVKVFEDNREFQVKKEEKEYNGQPGIFIEGYGSTFNNVDRHNDIVLPDAFKKTIRGLKLLPMLNNHKSDEQVGGWIKFKVDDTGLLMKGFIPESKENEHIITLIKSGMVNTLSIGGIFIYDREKDKKGNWLIKEVFLFETSIAFVPANPKAVFSMKSLVAPEQEFKEKGDPVEKEKAEEQVPDTKSDQVSDIMRKALNCIEKIRKEHE